MITRNAAHQYTYEGVQYPGVTSILKVMDKSDALMRWAARNTAEAALRLMEDKTEEGDALRSLVGTVGEEGVIKALTSRSSWKRDEAAQLGTEVHHLADLVVRGQPTPSMTETQRERVLHYAKWWEGQLKAGVKLRLSEAMVVKPDAVEQTAASIGMTPTGQVGWGGTFDLLYYDPDGRTVLADIKTGKAVYREAVLQLAAYGMASLVQPQGDGIGIFPGVYAMPLPDRYQVIHVTGEGVREVEINVGTAERMAFLACLDLWHWMESMKGKKL